MEPLTVLLGLTGCAVNWFVERTLSDEAPKLLSTAVGGIIGNRIDHVYCGLWNRIQGQFRPGGPPVNHDLERAVRKAWLQATLMAVEGCLESQGVPPSLLRREVGMVARPTECVRWLDGVRREMRRDLGRLHHDDYEPPASAAVTEIELLLNPGAASPEERRAALRGRLKAELLRELEEGHGPLPEPFAVQIRDGWRSSVKSDIPVVLDWFELLCAFFVHELKHRQEVANGVQGQLLANLVIEGRPLSADRFVEELRRAGGETVHRLDALDTLLADLQRGQAAGFERLEARLDELLPTLALLPDLQSQLDSLTGWMTLEAQRTRDHVTLEHELTREELSAHMQRLEASIEALSLASPAPLDRPVERSFRIGEQPPYHGEGIERRSDDETPYAPASALDQWLAAFADPDERCRVLVVHGPSGRGKSFAAKQLRRRLQEREPESLHFWLDCSFHPPRREALSQLFAEACPAPLRAEFAREFPRAFDPDSVEAPVFLAKLEALRGTFSRCYLYLDDLDHAADELESPRSYIQPFLRVLPQLPRLRLVVTCKDRGLVDTLENLLSGSGLKVRPTDPELAPLSEDHSEAYLRQKQILGLLPRSEREALVEAMGGEPLYLRLIEDVLDSLRENEPPDAVQEKQRALLREIVARREGDEIGALGASELHRDLRGLLFRHQLERLPEEAYELAVGMAVLSYGYVHDALIGEDVLRVVTGREDLAPARELLRRYRIATGEGFRLDLDAACDFLYEEGRLQGKKARGNHHAHLEEMHRKAAGYYAGRPNGQGAAVWHSACGRRYRQALRLLARASPEMEAAFLFADLLQLRRAVEVGLETVIPDREARAENDARLAEVFYQGFDRYALGEDAWQRAAQVVANFEGGSFILLQQQLEQQEELLAVHRPAGYRHRNALAYAEACLMLVVIAFEENSADWKELSAAAEEILAFADAEVKDDAFRANLLCNLGVFRNRGAQFDTVEPARSAEGAYREAFAALERLEPSIPDGSRRRLERDRLRIAVNLSRTVFLSESGGPASALQTLEGRLRDLDFAGTQEYLYGRVNACYYCLQLGDFAAAEEWLEGCRAFRSEKEALADKWIFDYVAAMDAALLLYRGEAGAARDAFEELSRTFDYGRDRTLMGLNARVAALSSLLWPPGNDSNAVPHDPARVQSCGELCGELQHWVDRGGGDKLPDVGDEPIAAETVPYLRWAIRRELERRSGLDLPDLTRPGELSERTRRRTERRFGALLYGAAGCEGPLLRLPTMMRGALILRSLPLAPLRSEREMG